ncbi:hypothetical protein PITCH_A1070023 [uncultured Desulfobacterium sp.]|uniref:Uncharacterized protein n=1 Tax=uncultured Desulfobacterium sp. TaxID=201089 RepID=A0A445MR14_9BACT|nr:hypothetical protein PITCH_A1070023 [uncultured Desulfobacterium sp.]
MKKRSIIILYFGIFLVFFGIAIQAEALPIPTLFFDGTATYTTTDNLINVNATLTDYQNLSLSPILTGSSLVFSALFTSSISDSFLTTGFFGTAPSNPDLTVIGGDEKVLLKGDISQLNHPRL